MAYCALILAVWSFFEGGKERRLIHGSLAMLAVVNVLFMVQGRTGYIVLAAFILYLFFRRFGKKGLLVGMLATALLGTSAYFGSNAFRERVDIAASEFIHWHKGHATKDTNSIGQRLEYDANTLAIIEKHPLFGVGTGGFRQAYAEEVNGTAMIPTHHPHNEFLLISSQLGLPGLALLLMLFYVEWIEAGRLPVVENHLARGLVLAMITGCLFNSFLLDHAEGLFFAFMTGVLFSARK
jgi:O-antigen ligase